MSASQSILTERMSSFHFISDNYHYLIIYHCLKKNTDLKDSDIIKAFKEAYRIGSLVVTDISLYNLRSNSFMEMAKEMDRNSLLARSISYALLSFHTEAGRLGTYLENLRNALETYYYDVFQYILAATISLSSYLPPADTFPPKKLITPSSNNRIQCDNNSIPISFLYERAQSYPPEESIIIQNFLLCCLSEHNKDWVEVMRNNVQRLKKLQNKQCSSKYRIAAGQLTNYCKIIKAMCETKIFEKIDGGKINQEEITKESCQFFNTTISNPSSILHSAKATNIYVDIFEDLTKTALKYINDDEAFTPTNKRR